MKNQFMSALYIFGIINLALWTANNAYKVGVKYFPQPPKERTFSNCQKYVLNSKGDPVLLGSREGRGFWYFGPTDQECGE
jgi:hypothetical protein